MQLWSLHWVGNCLIQVAIVNHKEYHVSKSGWGWYIIYKWSKWRFFYLYIKWLGSPYPPLKLCWLLNSKKSTNFENIVQSHCTMCVCIVYLIIFIFWAWRGGAGLIYNKPCHEVYPNLRNVIPCNVTSSLIYQNPRQQTCSMQISLLAHLPLIYHGFWH